MNEKEKKWDKVWLTLQGKVNHRERPEIELKVLRFRMIGKEHGLL